MHMTAVTGSPAAAPAAPPVMGVAVAATDGFSQLLAEEVEETTASLSVESSALLQMPPVAHLPAFQHLADGDSLPSAGSSPEKPLEGLPVAVPTNLVPETPPTALLLQQAIAPASTIIPDGAARMATPPATNDPRAARSTSSIAAPVDIDPSAKPISVDAEVVSDGRVTLPVAAKPVEVSSAPAPEPDRPGSAPVADVTKPPEPDAIKTGEMAAVLVTLPKSLPGEAPRPIAAAGEVGVPVTSPAKDAPEASPMIPTRTDQPVRGPGVWQALFAVSSDEVLSPDVPERAIPAPLTPLARDHAAHPPSADLPDVMAPSPPATATRHLAELADDPLTVSSLPPDALPGEVGFGTAPAPGSLATAPWALTALPQGAVAELAAQIGVSLAQRSDGVTEFTLSPEELGHVRVTLHPEATSDRVIVMLSFDRPETLDLFRRHADQLSAALQAAGYAGSSLDFAQSDRGRDNAPGPGHGWMADAPDDTAAAPLPRAAHGALDLRL